MEGRLQRRERFHGCVGAGTVVHLELDINPFRLTAIWSSKAHRHRNEFVVELARRNCGHGFLVTGQREFICLLAGNSEALCQALGGESHGKIRVGIVLNEPGIGAYFVSPHGNHGHRFHSARQNHVRPARHDSLCGHGDRLQSRRTKAIDRQRRTFNRQSRAKRGNTRHIHSLLRLWHRTAKNHVFNFFGIKLRQPRKRTFDSNCGHIVWSRCPQTTFVRPTDRRTHGTSYDYFTHLFTPENPFPLARSDFAVCPS